MLRFDRQYIATDRLCLFRFVERAIEFSFRDSFGDPGCRNALDLISPWLAPSKLKFPWQPRILRTEPCFFRSSNSTKETGFQWGISPAFLTTTLCFFPLSVVQT